MRYQIVKRKTKIVLLSVALFALTLLFIPGLYEAIFVHEEDLFSWDEPYEVYDFSDYSDSASIYKDLSLELRFLNDDYVLSELNIKNLDLEGIELSANIFMKGRFIRDKSGKSIGFSGKLISKSITLDSDEFRPLKASFKIINNELEIKSLSLGNSYELKGKLGLRKPYKTDFRLEIKRADARDLAIMAKAKKPEKVFGVINGVLYVKGDLKNLSSSGTLESRNGEIGPLRYNTATIEIEGIGPIINIVDSRLRHGDGGLAMDGYIDLRNITRGNLFAGVRIKSDIKTIVWDGWDITRDARDELTMSKDISDNMRIGFKTMAQKDLTTYYDRENPEEMNLEYKMGMKNLKMKLKETEEFFGVEHNVKF